MELYSNNTISGGFFTYGAQTVAEGEELHLGSGDFELIFTHPDYFSSTDTLTLTALTNTTGNFTGIYNAYVDILATNGETNASMNTFTATTEVDSYSTTNGTLAVPWLYNLTTELMLSSYGFANAYYNNTFLPNITSLGVTLYPENSVLINIYDEDTGLPIAQNTSIRITSSVYEGEVTTEGASSYFFGNLTPSDYQFYVNTSGYSPRTYYITVANASTQQLSVYLTSSTDTTIFTVYDADEVSTTIEGVYGAMYRLYGSTWMPVESKLTDVVGTAQFTYDSTANYKFVFTKTGYDNNIFYLNPILYSSYNIRMSQTTLLNYSTDYDGLILLYSPDQFDNGTNATFQFMFSSPDGDLLSYGYNLTYPDGVDITAGTNALGSQLSSNITINAETVFDYVQVNFYYETSLSGMREFTAILPINFVGADGSPTFASQREETYGLGIFERVFIITLILLFVVGIASLIGMPIEGLLLAMLVGGYCVYIGFIDVWIILPSILLGFFYVIWKTGE